jgi:hypothetical protein
VVIHPVGLTSSGIGRLGYSVFRKQTRLTEVR